MRAPRMLPVWLWTVLVIVVMTNASGAADATKGRQEMERASLQGLPGVYVLIESLKPEAERDGLTKAHLRTEMELRLRKAGIRVLTREEWFATPGSPCLYVNVNLLKDSFYHVYSYNILVELNQDAYLARDSSHSWATTWKKGGLGSVSIADLRRVRDNVGDEVDAFINDYLSVNPRAVPSPSPSTSSDPGAGLSHPSSPSSRRSLIRQVQERLQAVGFTPGTIDGTLGSQTQQALRWFQNTKGLLATGDLDEHTLDALGVR
jgi:hypothetical protein